MMRIAEIFTSIQGEERYAETPSVFVRTTGCNLRCWFCDTPYTSWKPEGTALSLDELTRLSVERIQELAREPLAFDVPTVSTRCDQAAVDWQAAVGLVEREAEAARQRRATANGSARLNRATLDFIRVGAGSGDRHRLLFSAAANLAEFGCPNKLAHELLTEAALDSGLSPSEVRRQIDCGLKHQPAVKSTTLFTVEPPPSGGYYNAGL